MTSAALRVSIVTPSLNQAAFLPACMRSVLGQRHPNLEYIVIDGGSTDGSVDIIDGFEKHLAYCVSEPDGGPYDALNKGFARATGEVLAWLNADDMYTPWALGLVSDIFAALPAVEWISTLYPLCWDAHDRVSRCWQLTGFDPGDVLRGGLGVPQASTFWRRSLWERAGARLDTVFSVAADLELWARFWQHAVLYGVPVPLAGTRSVPGRRGGDERYAAEAAAVLGRYRPAHFADGHVGWAIHALLPRQVRRLLTRFGVPYRAATLHAPKRRIITTGGGWTTDKLGRPAR